MVALKLLFWSAWAVIFYAYVGFPLLLAAFARLSSRRSHQPPDAVPDTQAPRVAMVVAAFNEERVLAAKLENSRRIDYPQDRFQLVIGSDGSTDATEEILDSVRDPWVCAHLFQERRGKISVLNELMASVDADIVVMSDANTMFDPDAIRKLVAHFDDPRVGCVSGELGLEQEGGVSGEGLYWRYEGWIKRNESRLGFLIGCNGGIFAIRKELFRPLPASTIVEDFVLSVQILERGWLVRFEPAARATEPACANSREEMVRKIRIGAGGFQALGLTRGLLHPRFGLRAFAYWGHKVLRWCVPMLLLVAMSANIGLARSPLYGAALAMQLIGIGLSIRAYQGGASGVLSRLVRPVSYFYLMNYALWRGFLRFLFGTQRVTWDRAQQVLTHPSASLSMSEASAWAAPEMSPRVEVAVATVVSRSEGHTVAMVEANHGIRSLLYSFQVSKRGAVVGNQSVAIDIDALKRAERAYRNSLAGEPGDTAVRLRLAWCLFVQAVHQAGRESMLHQVEGPDGRLADQLPAILNARHDTQVDTLLKDCLHQTTIVLQLTREDRERTDVELLQALITLAGADQLTAEARQQASRRLSHITQALVYDTSISVSRPRLHRLPPRRPQTDP